MTDAYKCERCGDYFDDDPEVIRHDASAVDTAWSRDLCHECFHGLIEYLAGVDSDTANSMAPER